MGCETTVQYNVVFLTSSNILVRFLRFYGTYVVYITDLKDFRGIVELCNYL